MHSSDYKEGQEEMERYWMRRREKPSDHEGPLFHPPTRAITLNTSSYKASWEEKAFTTQDSEGLFGVYAWPPRSYPCSFCRREFRSAQALGGHMNVHRRDRARLKLSSTSTVGHNQDSPHGHGRDPYANAPQAALERSSKPNPNSLCGDHDIASPLSSHNRDLVVSAATEIWSEHIFIYPAPCSLPNVRHNKKDTTLSFTVQCSDEDPKTVDPPRSIQELAHGRDNLGRRPRRRHRDEDSEETIDGKRSKTNHTISPLFARSFAGKGQQFQPHEVLQLCSNSVEELDLELRLGDPRKI